MLNKIPEYQVLHNKIREHKQLLNKQRRLIKSKKEKIKHLNEKYKFIFDMFSPEIGDIELEKCVQMLFLSIGYKDVIHLTEDTRNPDIVVNYNEFKTVIEVKNTLGQTITENDIFQVHKYKQRQQDDFIDSAVRGILVLNNCNRKPLDQRNKNPFDIYRERDAKLNNYSLVTTSELLNAFILIKRNELTLEEFDKVIHTHGVVKFSKRKIKIVLAEQV